MIIFTTSRDMKRVLKWLRNIAKQSSIMGKNVCDLGWRNALLQSTAHSMQQFRVKHTELCIFTLLCSLLAQFNIPDNDVISRGGAEDNRTASFSKSKGTDVTMVTS